ncbi:hypothetical protein [Pedobacter sp. Leaf132]|uniref:hypothetical protein n=1 Tax=Pedobacter sp. Leaf132 TaxID=2876557 RepID=UPI001E4262CE|nr:hypothetical protein [Pedobacter sp. Leaf132]
MDFLNSFFQNIKDKLTSPFFGTLTFILIIHHWEFWYTIFNFDKDLLLHEKLYNLRVLAQKEFSIGNIAKDVLWALIIVVIGYIVVVTTRTLSIFIEFRAMPWITGKVTSKLVIDKKTYDDVLQEKNLYSEKYEEQRQLVRQYSRDYDSQEEQVQNKNKQLNELNSNITEFNNQISHLNNNASNDSRIIDDLRKEVNEKQSRIENMDSEVIGYNQRLGFTTIDVQQYREIFFSQTNRPFWNSKEKFPPSIHELVLKLKQDNIWKDFIAVANFERHAGSISTGVYAKLEPYALIIPGTERLTAVGSILAANYELFA